VMFGVVGEIPGHGYRDQDSLPSALRDALGAVKQVAEKEEELSTLGTTVQEQFRGHAICSQSLEFGHPRECLDNLFWRERWAQRWFVGFGVLTEAWHQKDPHVRGKPTNDALASAFRRS
jgi:hypothetical protein